MQVRLLPGALITRWPRRLPARTPPSQGGEAGSTPVGATALLRSPGGGTGRRASLRCSCPSWAWEFESPLGDCGRAGARPSLINSECWVRLPGPQLSGDGRVGKRAKPPVRETGACGFDSHSGYCIVPSSSGQDACLTHRMAQVRVLPGRLGSFGPQVLRAARLRGREAVRVRVPSGPLVRDRGLLVQQQDACPARRRSGCDSPAVH
jgi:hypothetical protein